MSTPSLPNLPDILARLAAATPGPWHRMTVPDGDSIDGPTGEDYLTNCIGAMDSDHNETFIADTNRDADATLIANAPGDPTEAARLAAAGLAGPATPPGLAAELQAIAAEAARLLTPAEPQS